jgi:nitrogen fixation protein FixH
MKINWGTGIAIFYIVFVVALVVQVYKSTQYDNSLVSEQYYADDLAYQQHYVKLVNSQQLEQDLIIKEDKKSDQVILQFPANLPNLGGEIHLFCPSNSHQDVRVEVDVDDKHRQIISTEGLQRGLWRIKVDWTSGSKEFYKEEVVTL